MAESLTAETLRNKRDEIASSIDDYMARLEQAGADLAHMDAAIAIFASDDGKPVRPYADIDRLFKRGELAAISRDSLRDGPRNTRELTQAIMPRPTAFVLAFGTDVGDPCLDLAGPVAMFCARNCERHRSCIQALFSPLTVKFGVLVAHIKRDDLTDAPSFRRLSSRRPSFPPRIEPLFETEIVEVVGAEFVAQEHRELLVLPENSVAEVDAEHVMAVLDLIDHGEGLPRWLRFRRVPKT